MSDREPWDELEQWLKGRPQCIKNAARKTPPWRAYKIAATGQLCSIISFLEPSDQMAEVTARVKIIPSDTHLLEGIFGDYEVFGIPVSGLLEVN